ncbi:MAG TPA: type II toxin-antitoxin system RelE/ParE family toxin [Chlamydiales bacterium]|nr:type II toxin-antitoxin system RelE/ParE family toxin [Chlamydiales bacterium]
MKIKITLLRQFSRDVDSLIENRALLEEDFNVFKKMLSENPESGPPITGTGGVRKIRLKSATKGKSRGFRVCYFHSPERNELFLMCIYGKNKQENISPAEKKELKALVAIFKEK